MSGRRERAIRPEWPRSRRLPPLGHAPGASTSPPDVWAIDECAGSPPITDGSFDDFRIIRDNLTVGNRNTRDRLVPYCLFTDPLLARVGLNERRARLGPMVSGYAPLGEYGVIGDLHTVALVSTDASIDFLCLPSFDSPSVFTALLDAGRGGRFQVAPQLGGAARRQLYLPDTNILLTRFLDTDGVAEVSDFMPAADGPHALTVVRRAKTVRGKIRFQMRCEPRFDYGRAPHTAEQRSECEVLLVGRSGAGELALRLRGAVPLRLEGAAVVAEFTLGADESAWFVLEIATPSTPSPSERPDYEREAFKETVNFWRRWIARSTYRGRWREMVNRSALTLKLLTSEEYGSIVAAPTFGLPESIGGGRNWDYRYAWIRDSSFTLYGLMRLGFTEEAAAFMRWVLARCQELEPDGSLQILYGIDGRHELPEETLPHLQGYMGSQSVRIGNAAYR